MLEDLIKRRNEIADIYKRELVELVEKGKIFLTPSQTYQELNCVIPNDRDKMFEFLKENGVATIAVVGLLTNVSVESTARAGYDSGYEVLILKDCTGCRSQSWQEYAEQNIFPMLGKVMDHNEFLNSIQ
jgi:nicotinamidase-related amidase